MRPLNVLAAITLPLSTADRYPNDFSPYPAAAQSCLNAADQKSGCDGSSVPAMNGCLCTNTSNFVPSAARCIRHKSPNDLGATYDILKINCDGSKTPMAITKEEFLQLGVTSTTRQMPEETHQDDEESTEGSKGSKGSKGSEGSLGRERQGGGLTTGAKIGIAVSAVVVVGLISAGLLVGRSLAKDKSQALREAPAEKAASQRTDVAELE